MSGIEKLIDRFRRMPTDFSWNELEKLLRHFGFEPLGTGGSGGSRRKFFNREKRSLITLHEPHPRPILKEYQLKEVFEKLTEGGFLPDGDDEQ